MQLKGHSSNAVQSILHCQPESVLFLLLHLWAGTAELHLDSRPDLKYVCQYLAVRILQNHHQLGWGWDDMAWNLIKSFKSLFAIFSIQSHITYCNQHVHPEKLKKATPSWQTLVITHFSWEFIKPSTANVPPHNKNTLATSWKNGLQFENNYLHTSHTLHGVGSTAPFSLCPPLSASAFYSAFFQQQFEIDENPAAGESNLVPCVT